MKNKTLNIQLNKENKKTGCSMLHTPCSVSRGFTLIEMMISTALFVVIVTIGIGAILNTTKAHKQSAELRQSMDTMYFVMEEMTRNIRLGSRFETSFYGSSDCPIGQGNTFALACSSDISFENYLTAEDSDNTNQYVYRISEDTNSPGNFFLEKSKASGASNSWFRMTPSNIKIDPAKSGFSISNNSVYPLINIRLMGTATYQNVSTPFNVQTTISPRSYY